MPEKICIGSLTRKKIRKKLTLFKKVNQMQNAKYVLYYLLFTNIIYIFFINKLKQKLKNRIIVCMTSSYLYIYKICIGSWTPKKREEKNFI